MRLLPRRRDAWSLSRSRHAGTLLVLGLAAAVGFLGLVRTRALGVIPARAAVPSQTPHRATPRRGVFPAFARSVPVLLYHAVGAGADGASTRFAAQLRRLKALGFQAITLDQYVRFVRGDKVDLPPRPILITFDDARLSARTIADRELARYRWRAAMYVPTGLVGLPGYLTWQHLREMQASGRWQIDEHAGDGHALVPATPAGGRSPFYASRIWADGKYEPFTGYKRRVSSDIARGAAALAAHLPAWRSHGTFAVPFGNYGQRGSNDARIESWLSGYLRARFAAIFVQSDESFTTPGLGFANRITVSSGWDAATLETHLLRGLALSRRSRTAKVRARR